MGPTTPIQPKIVFDDGESTTFLDSYGDTHVVPKNSPGYESLLQAFGGGGSGGGSSAPAAREGSSWTDIFKGPTELSTDPIVPPNAAPPIAAASIAPIPAASPQALPASGTVAPMDQSLMAGSTFPPQSLPLQPAMPIAAAPQVKTDVKTTTSTDSKSIAPKAEKALDTAVAKQAEAIGMQADAAIKKNEQDHKILDLQNQHLVELEKQQQIKELDRQNKIAQMDQDIQNVTSRFQDMKVDPNFFGRMDTGNKVLSVIGMIMSGVGAAATGQENMALKILEKAAEQDIDAQKTNINNAKAGIELKRGGLKDYITILGDQRAAELAEKNRILEGAKRQLELVMVSPNANEMVKANAAKSVADINARQAEFKASQNQNNEKRVRENETSIVAGGPKGSNLKEAPSHIQESVMSKHQALQGLHDIKTLFEGAAKDKIGPIKGRLNQISGKLGIQGKDEAEVEQALTQSIIEKVFALSGKAASQNERETLAKTLPKITDNYEAFMTKLNQEIKKGDRNLDTIYKQYEGQYILPNRLKFEDSDVEDKKSKVGFKPQ